MRGGGWRKREGGGRRFPNVKTSPTFASEGGWDQNNAGKSSYIADNISPCPNLIL